MHDFPWYRVIEEDDLQQGDILEEFEFIDHPEDISLAEVPAQVKSYDVIIMTQSCDLVKREVKHVVLCPIWPIEEAESINPIFVKVEGKNKLIDGHVIGYHLINECSISGFERPMRIVEFRRILEAPKQKTLEKAQAHGGRLRLQPPYREHMAQAFARFFMRVGLPIDIPKFK